MENKKYRFNIIDAVIIIVIAAVLSSVGYQIYTGNLAVNNYVPIRYVVEVENLREEFSDKVSAGQAAYSESTGQLIGNVAVVEDRAATRAYYNSDESGQAIGEIPGMRVMYVTFTANASVTDGGYLCGGESVRTGSILKIMLPDLYCEGTCISVEAVG